MYDIKILSDQDFDALPYSEAAVSLGVADPKTSTAYVRYTGVGPLNDYLVEHEFEHLLDPSDKEHYRDGVYYKGFGNMFQGFGQGLGSLFGGGASGATANAARSGVAQAVSNPMSQFRAPAGFWQTQTSGFKPSMMNAASTMLQAVPALGGTAVGTPAQGSLSSKPVARMPAGVSKALGGFAVGQPAGQTQAPSTTSYTPSIPKFPAPALM